MNKRDGGPAFAAAAANEVASHIQDGMSLRDWFAGQALAGVLARSDLAVGEIRGVVIGAYMIADAMLTERSKEPTND